MLSDYLVVNEVGGSFVPQGALSTTSPAHAQPTRFGLYVTIAAAVFRFERRLDLGSEDWHRQY